MLLLLRRGREYVFFQLLILRHAIWEVVTAVISYAVLIILPYGSGRRSGHVRPNDEFDGEGCALPYDAHVRMRRGQEVIRYDVFRDSEPIRARQVQYLSLVGNDGEHAIETGLTIGRDECELRGAEVVPIPYLPGHAGRDDAGFGVEGDVVARDLFGSIVRGRYLVHVRFVPAVGGVVVVRHGGARSVRSGMVCIMVCGLRFAEGMKAKKGAGQEREGRQTPECLE